MKFHRYTEDIYLTKWRRPLQIMFVLKFLIQTFLKDTDNLKTPLLKFLIQTFLKDTDNLKTPLAKVFDPNFFQKVWRRSQAAKSPLPWKRVFSF